MTITIEVPDGSPKAEEMAAWKDGETYDLSVVQTAPGKFDIAESESKAEDATETEEEPGTMAEMANKFNEKE